MFYKHTWVAPRFCKILLTRGTILGTPDKLLLKNYSYIHR